MGQGEIKLSLGHEEHSGVEKSNVALQPRASQLYVTRHPLRHNKSQLSVTQSGFALGLRAEKDLKVYFLFSQASCLVDEESRGG